MSSSSRAPWGDTYPGRPAETTLLFGPHANPTEDRDPRPEEEEEEELLPEPTDFGRPDLSSLCDPDGLTEESSLVSAERKWKLGSVKGSAIKINLKRWLKKGTSSHQGIVYGSVVDSCLAGLDVHERLVSNSQEHSLLHANLFKNTNKGNIIEQSEPDMTSHIWWTD